MLKSKNVLNWTHIRYDPNALKDYVNFCKAIKAGHVVSFYSPISYWRRSLSKMYLFIYNWYRLRTYIGKKTVETNLVIYQRTVYLVNTEWGSIWGHESEVSLEAGLVHVSQGGEEPVHVLLCGRQAVGHLLGLVH